MIYLCTCSVERLATTHLKRVEYLNKPFKQFQNVGTTMLSCLTEEHKTNAESLYIEIRYVR